MRMNKSCKIFINVNMWFSSGDVTSLCKTIESHVWCWNTQQRGRRVFISQSWSVTWLVEVQSLESIVQSEHRQLPLLESDSLWSIASTFINSLTCCLLLILFGGCFYFLRTSQARLRRSVDQNQPPGFILSLCAPVQANRHMLNALLEFVFNAPPRKQGKCSHAGKERANFHISGCRQTLILIHRGRLYTSNLILWWCQFLMPIFFWSIPVGLMVLTPGLCIQPVRHSYWILLNPQQHYSVTLLSNKKSVGVRFLHWAVNSNNGEKTSRSCCWGGSRTSLLQFR